jgi:PPOX class probable F420-dependent enzyme
MSTAKSTSPFERFARQKTVALTTFRRDGRGVSTPMSIVVDGDHAYIRTPHAAGKAKRLRNNPAVELAPSTLRGTPTGSTMRATARLLSESETPDVRRALARKYPFLQGFFVPLVHRVQKNRTLHYELTAVPLES